MKKQGYNDKLHEHLGEKHKGPHKQSLKARSDESEAMEKKHGKGKYAAVKTMDQKHKMVKAPKAMKGYCRGK
jgi:hypothetical protein